MKRHTVLVSVDGSDRALAALPYAITLAVGWDAGIELLAVAEDVGRERDAPRLQDLLARGLAAYVADVRARVSALGVPAEAVVRSGQPHHVILTYAEKRRSRAVVMTTRGASGLDRWTMGSVADTVIRLARCPVFAVRQAEPRDPYTPWCLRRLLVPLDGSPQAEAALPDAFDLARSMGAEVMLARVQPWFAIQVAAFGDYIPDLAAWEEEASHAAAAYLESIRERAPSDVGVRCAVLRGDPAERLIGLVRADAIDAVVMMSHNRHGPNRTLLGSVTDRIIRAGIPTMVVHPQVADEREAARERMATLQERSE